MDKVDKIWLYGSVSVSLIASLVVAVSVRKTWISCETAAAGASIKICDWIFGETSSPTLFWIYCVNNFLESYNHSPASEKALGEFVIPSLRELVKRRLRQDPVSEIDFSSAVDSLLSADRRFGSPALYDDMEDVRNAIVNHWGSDSSLLLYTYFGSLDILNALSARYAGKENDRNIEYSTALTFEACRLGNLHGDDQVAVWTSCQRLVRLGEYYFVHGQYAKASDFYSKVLKCVPAAVDREGHLKALVEERIIAAKANQAGRIQK